MLGDFAAFVVATAEHARIPPEMIKEIAMVKRRLAVLLTAGALVTGAGAAVALGDDDGGQSPSSPSTTCPTTVASTAPQDQNDQVGVDEQEAANDVADAANDVQVEADDQSADDQSGDQQGPNDQSEEPDDNCQGDD